MGSAHLRACPRTWTLCPALLLPLKSHVPFSQDLPLHCFCFLNWFPVFFKQSLLLSSLPAPRITNSSVSSYQSDGEYLPSLQGNTHALGLMSTGMLESLWGDRAEGPMFARLIEMALALTPLWVLRRTGNAWSALYSPCILLLPSHPPLARTG